MTRQRKAAQQAEETPAPESVPATDIPAADAATGQRPGGAPEAPERQPGDEPAEQKRSSGPDPFVIDTNPAVGLRLLSSHRYFDKASGRYAFRDIQIKFDDKPGQAILDKLKEAGFEWDRDNKAWSKKVPKDEAIRTRVDAERLFQEVLGLLRAAKGLGQEKAPF
jgi:hypothetical protein